MSKRGRGGRLSRRISGRPVDTVVHKKAGRKRGAKRAAALRVKA